MLFRSESLSNADPFPKIWIEYGGADDWSNKDDNGLEAFVNLHVGSQKEGTKEIRGLMDKCHGVIVETATEGDKKQTRGSQIPKVITMDMFSNGEVSEGYNKEEIIAANKEFNSAEEGLAKFRYEELLDRLGIKIGRASCRERVSSPV